MSYRKRRIALTVSLVGAIVMATVFCVMAYNIAATAQVNSGGYGISNNYRLPADSGSARQVHIITIDELTDLLKSNQSYVIVDTRSRDAFDKAHLPGAVSIPLNLTDSYAGKLDKNQLIVTYCESFQSPESAKAAEEFMKLGFTNVWDYKGGIKEWKDKGYPIYGQ